ncbi:MAG: hypothetical protein HKN03_03415 [Acidimicrobiales bacterium]|nr:hypothetical protein [Acidimicrobiales bacterium]
MSAPGDPTAVVVLAYDGVAADEAGAIVEIMTTAGIPVVIASVESNPVTSYHGRVVPTQPAIELARCAALVVPGGMGVRTASQKPELTKAIATVGAGAKWIGATSTGSILLVGAGLTPGARITTHWLAAEMLDNANVEVVNEPFIHDGRVLTASGVASTATLAFRLVAILRGPEAEKLARSSYTPRVSQDTRYGRLPWWRRLLGRGTSDNYTLDPTGEAELIILEWDDDL